jgi:hypothetical protein
MMEAVRTSEMSVDNHFTRQYNPEDSSEQELTKVTCPIRPQGGILQHLDSTEVVL